MLLTTTSAELAAGAKQSRRSFWGVAGWLQSLSLANLAAEALHEPPGADPFAHVLSLSRTELDHILEEVQLLGLAPRIWSAIEKLRSQGAATGAELNAKFAAEGDAFKGEMGFGGTEQFFGGARAFASNFYYF